MTAQVPPFPRSRYVLFFALMVLGFVADWGSKNAVFDRLGVNAGHPTERNEWIFEGPVSFKLHTTFNHGALWGVGQGLSWMFAALSIFAVVAVVIWLFVFRGAISKWLTTALGLVMAGTLGNLWDRLGLHGIINEGSGQTEYAVRDFLFFRLGDYPWPIFNLADVFLVTGAIMLVIQSLRGDVVAKKTEAAKATAVAG